MGALKHKLAMKSRRVALTRIVTLAALAFARWRRPVLGDYVILDGFARAGKNFLTYRGRINSLNCPSGNDLLTDTPAALSGIPNPHIRAAANAVSDVTSLPALTDPSDASSFAFTASRGQKARASTYQSCPTGKKSEPV
jgi:hypothetical protein